MSGYYELDRGITYCHHCRQTRDALALVKDMFQCTLFEAFDILDAEGLIIVDSSHGVG